MTHLFYQLAHSLPMKGEGSTGLKPGILSMGEPLVEFSDMGNGMYGASISGDAVNVAVSASRLGFRSAVASAVGDDYFGRFVSGRLEEEGVSTEFLSSVRGGFTGIYFITLTGGGGHEFTYYRKGSSASSYRITREELEASGRWQCFHYSGIAQAIGSAAKKSAVKAASRAASAGSMVSYDVNYRPRLWERGEAMEELVKAAGLADILFISTEDWQLLSGEKLSPAGIARRLVGMGAGRIVVKAGSDGSYGYEKRRVYRQKSFHVEAVDATGAGDAYDAGFLCSILSGGSFSEAMRHGSMNAAIKCTMKGGTRGLPSASRLKRALKSAHV